MSQRAPRLLVAAPRLSQAHEAAYRFTSYLSELERRLRRGTDAVPPLETRGECAAKFASMVTSIQRVLIEGGAIDAAAEYRRGQPLDVDVEQTKREIRQILGPWLWRSDLFHRANHKPHGHAGDYRTLEMLYSLEHDAGCDPTKPAIVNCLDHIVSTFPFVHSLWGLRRRTASLLAQEQARLDGAVAILDVGCGGAPYLRDHLSSAADSSRTAVTLIDQDVSALAYCKQTLTPTWPVKLEEKAGAWRHVLPDQPIDGYDVVIASGLLEDIEDDEIARDLIVQLVRRVRPGGALLLSSFRPEDPSDVARDWILDWRMSLRREDELLDLCPAGEQMTAARSVNHALATVIVRRTR